MSFRDCMDEIRRASDGSMSDDEIMEVLEEFDAVARATAEQRPWANVQQELFGHAEKLAKQAREQVLIKRRNQLADNRKEAGLRGILEQPEWAKDPNAAVTAKAFGSLGFAKGGKASVHRQGVALGRFWIGSLDNALEKEGLGRVLQSGALDRQIAVEMWELGRTKGKPGVSGSKEALAAAKIIHRLQEAMVGRLNRAGAYIKRMPGYIVRQTHDARLIKRAGFDKWFAATWPKVDEMRTFNRLLADDEREAIYRGLWQELAAGRHPSAVQDQSWSSFMPAGGSLAKRLSQHRELHFKTGADWHGYHEAFGRGTILENVARSAQSNGRAAALMETFGSRPKQMLERWAAEADDQAVKIGAKTSEAKGRFSTETLWGVMSGEMNRPSDGTLARLGNAVRSWQIASKMGSAVVTAYLTDPVLQGNELARHGVPFMRRAVQPMMDVFRLATESGEQRQLANMLQAYRDGLLSETWGRFDSGDGLPGVTSWMARKLMKWSGMNWWTDAHRAGITAVISHQLAERSAVGWAELAPDYRRMMEAYGIGEADWPRIGRALTEVEGTSYVVPHQLKLEDFGDTGTAAGRRAARRARDELATKLMTFVDDRMAAGVLEPGARTRAMLVSERPGTWRGEAWRAFALFKSFPVEILNRVWGERVAHSEYGTLAALVATMGVMGVATNVLRDALRGIETDWSELSPAQMAQVFFRGMATGGGAGLMGDFVLGEHNRYGRTFIATQAGPVFGQVDTIAEIYAAVVRGEDAGAKAVRALYTNIPFINLWWSRTVLDYLLLYTIQEWMNPGYLARMERNKEKETGQRFILAPSSVHG